LNLKEVKVRCLKSNFFTFLVYLEKLCGNLCKKIITGQVSSGFRSTCSLNCSSFSSKLGNAVTSSCVFTNNVVSIKYLSESTLHINYKAHIKKFTERGILVCLWLRNRVPYLIKYETKLELEKGDKLVNKDVKNRREYQHLLNILS
jgi:hypothetical protein